MRFFIVGDANSIHLLNYIKVVLSDFNNVEITLLDMNLNSRSNKEAYNYYNKNNIKVVFDNKLSDLIENSIIRKIPKIRTEIYLSKLSKKVKHLGEFDYCILHYVDQVKANLALNHKWQFKNIIPIFWGSDLLRNPKIGNNLYKRLFEISYRIVFNTENMIQKFKTYYGESFSAKSKVIKFPTLSFETIDNIESNFSKKELRRNLGLPLDKYIIICGHAGSKAEQHEELLAAISKCNERVKDKCYFVFPMTYGGANLINRQQEVISLMNNYGVEGEVLRDYLGSKEMLKIISCSDIHITVIKTDAFSGVMQENLYSGSYVIYGKWLNYYELENGILAKSVEKIYDVTKELEKAVLKYKSLKPELRDNRKLISSISSPISIRFLWNKEIFGNEELKSDIIRKK